jgi:molybdopterin-guanine dinucleotide biosynthesis protein A
MSCCGIVLAGGASRRMGSDKALITFEGRTLLARALDLLAERCEARYVSAADQRYTCTDATLIVDRDPGAGPLPALADALERAERDGHERALVVACDAVLLASSLLERLTRTLDDSTLDAALALDDQRRPQPLVACYRVSSARALRKALAEGERRLRSVEQRLSWRAVALAKGERLVNLNTPGQLEALMADGWPLGSC